MPKEEISELPAFEANAMKVGKGVDSVFKKIARVIELPATIAKHKGAKGITFLRIACYLVLIVPPLWPVWLIMFAITSASKSK